MRPLALALTAVVLAAAPALAQTGATRTPVLPPSTSPSTVGPQSSSGTPSSFATPQPFGTTSPIDPSTGLPTNLPPSSGFGARTLTSPPIDSPSATRLPPPVWSSPSPSPGQAPTPGRSLTPGSR